MIDAMHKVATTLMERYDTTCVSCGWYRHFFGTAKEARESALRMGWEFRKGQPCMADAIIFRSIRQVSPEDIEMAYCPHCKLLVKEKP
jgi:hypothetical protein